MRRQKNNNNKSDYRKGAPTPRPTNQETYQNPMYSPHRASFNWNQGYPPRDTMCLVRYHSNGHEDFMFGVFPDVEGMNLFRGDKGEIKPEYILCWVTQGDVFAGLPQEFRVNTIIPMA